MSLNKAAEIAKPPVYRIIFFQFLTSFFLVGVWALFVDWEQGVAAAMGAAINTVPNIYFVRMAFRYQGARQADQVAKSFYRGEAGKFASNLALFVVLFVIWPQINVIALFCGYALAQLLYWVALVVGWDKKKHSKA